MRQKTYIEYDVPPSVVRMVSAICADYERRERMIKYSAVSGAVLDRNIELNAAIDRALISVETGIREDLLCDIGNGTGYYKSVTAGMLSKGAYYRRRRKLIHDIAVNLSLL